MTLPRLTPPEKYPRSVFFLACNGDFDPPPFCTTTPFSLPQLVQALGRYFFFHETLSKFLYFFARMRPRTHFGTDCLPTDQNLFAPCPTPDQRYTFGSISSYWNNPFPFGEDILPLPPLKKPPPHSSDSPQRFLETFSRNIAMKGIKPPIKEGPSPILLPDRA